MNEDQVSVLDSPEPPRRSAVAPLTLLYRDDHYVAVHKPSGLLVHRSPIDRHETAFALQRARNLIGQRVFPVHRLDKPTSGVLLFALSPHAASRAMQAFAAGRVEKRYLAVVRGHPAATGCIDHPLVEEHAVGPAPPADARPAPQAAVTDYLRLATAELPHAVGRYASARYALVQLSPRHGRRHQLRRHLAHISHPVIGDTSHGDGRHNRFFRTHLGVHRLLLAAVRLAFEHPFSGASVQIDAPPEGSFAAPVEALGWADAVIDALAAPPAP